MLNDNKRQITAKRTLKRMLHLIAIWTTEQTLQFQTGDNTLGWGNQQ